MQRIEIPKGSKVTIEDGVILIEPAKWKPKKGEIVRIYAGGYTIIGFYTNARGDNVTTGINEDNELRINGIGIHDNFTFFQTSEDNKTRLLTALSDAGYQYNEETHEVEKIRWKPKLGDIYWTFNSNAVFKSTCNTNDLDIERINNGFVFKTEAKVREFFDKIKQLANENR